MGDIENEADPEIRGDLQKEVMRILWSEDPLSVEEVRQKLPRSRDSAYTTVQTVLNRLAERGLVSRDTENRAIRYRPAFSESDQLAMTIRGTLTGASEQARTAALANLVGDLDAEELERIRRIADDLRSTDR